MHSPGGLCGNGVPHRITPVAGDGLYGFMAEIPCGSGGRVVSRTLTPQTGFTQATKVDTVWVAVVTANNSCLGYYTALSGGRSAVVQ